MNLSKKEEGNHSCEDYWIQIKSEELRQLQNHLPVSKAFLEKKGGSVFHLFGSVLQADKFPIDIYLFDADIPGGWGGVRDANATARLWLFHIDSLPLSSSCAHTPTRGRSGHCHTRRRAWGEFQSTQEKQTFHLWDTRALPTSENRILISCTCIFFPARAFLKQNITEYLLGEADIHLICARMCIIMFF